MLVSHIDILLQSGQLKTIDRKHGRGRALTAFHRVADKALLESQYGKASWPHIPLKKSQPRAFFALVSKDS